MISNGGYLEVTTLTWNHETYGLFDYDNKSLKKKAFKINSSCSIYREDENCFINNRERTDHSEPLLDIQQKNLDFQLSLLTEDSYSNMWLVVKDIKRKGNKGYKAKEKEWLKLGRVKLRVQSICLDQEKNNANVVPDLFKTRKTEELLEKEEKDKDNKEGSSCRICLCNIETEIDPLISPCKCSGTMKYIHLNCLKEWLKNKIESRISSKGMSFYIKDLSCELCKFSMPSSISHNGYSISLLCINLPTKPYIVIEEYTPERNIAHGLHFVALNNNESAIIGRGNDCDIKITDISVSRKHCKIKYHNSQFFIEDCQSKFGTLVKLQRSFTIKGNVDISIQINRTVFHVAHKRPWTFKSCFCFKNKSKVMHANGSSITQSEFQDNLSEVFSNAPSYHYHYINEEEIE